MRHADATIFPPRDERWSESRVLQQASFKLGIAASKTPSSKDNEDGGRKTGDHEADRADAQEQKSGGEE